MAGPRISRDAIKLLLAIEVDNIIPVSTAARAAMFGQMVRCGLGKSQEGQKGNRVVPHP